MLVSLLLLTLLADAPSTSPGAAPQTASPATPVLTFAEASQLAADGRNAEALIAFQRLASINPNDHQARIWIARMHERLGRPAVAEAVYRSVLLEDPSNVDAMLGIGTTLLARHFTDDAIDMLARAEALAPEREDILDAQGRAHREAGDEVRAITYFQRVVAMSPTEQHMLQLEDARSSYLHRVEAHGLSEDFNTGTSTTAGGGATVNYRLNDRYRVFGRGDAQRKFGISDQRGGGGVEWRWRPLTSFAGHVLIGPGNVIMPEGDYIGEVDHTYANVSWTGTYRYLDFNGAWMAVLSPAVTWWPTDRMSAGLRYAHAISRSNLLLTNEHGNSLHARGAYRYRPRLWLLGGYATGIEDFDTVSIDQIGNFKAHSVSGGVRWDLPSLTSLTGTYDYQWRADSVRRGRLVVSLAHRF
jgi:Flp pilus assembly protein TadD